MARNWGHSSWNQWWETEAKKFDALEAKCDWLQSMLEEKCNEMRRLDGEVTRLGQRVSEAENVNAVLEQKLADLRNGVAGASAAGVSEIPHAEAPGCAGLKREFKDLRIGVAGASANEIPAEAPVVGELPQAKRLASTSDEDLQKKWRHPEAKENPLTATSGTGPCQNCHGGIVLDPKEELRLREMWSKYPLNMWPFCSHLGSTLFLKHGTRTWPAIEKKLTKIEGRFLFWGSKVPNSRFWVCMCADCRNIVMGQYGAWDDAEEHEYARDELARFVLGKEKAEDSKQS